MAQGIKGTQGIFVTYEEACENFEHLKRKITEDDSDITSMMAPEHVGFNYEEKTMTVRFIAKEWEINARGVVHGGIITTMLDHAAGCGAYLFESVWTPSIDISVKHMSQVNVGDELICVGHVMHAGKRFIVAEATLFNETTGKMAGTLLGTYANGATNSSEKR